jgi:hypothetical protein
MRVELLVAVIALSLLAALGVQVLAWLEALCR